MVVNGRPLKRMNARVTAHLNDFLTFPDSSNPFSGPFRSNIRAFLSNHTHLPPSSSIFPSLLVWQIFFRIGDSIDDPDSSSPQIVTLDVVEEDVTRSRSRSIYCDQCRVIGWSGHPVSGKRYHFIIRRNNSFSDGHQKPCTNCGILLPLSDIRCKSCLYELNAVDFQDWMQHQLEDTTHLLHGVIHGNGYGHLLRVNGREGGSTFLSGFHIMDFWDRLCKTLGARKISVMDVSKKYGLEFRLLHAITNGHTWYGNWGFEFGSGSFALTVDAYRKAVDFLSKIPLSLFFQGRKPRTRLQDVITFYQALSECQLSTIRELFCFLIGLLRNAERSQSQAASKNKKYGMCSQVLCTWTREDIERVQLSMIKVLQVAGRFCWVSWRALKGAAFKLASSELLDYCLKVLGGQVFDDGRMVLSRCNPETDAIEYRLVSRNDMRDVLSTVGSNCPSKDHILRDLKYLFDDLLNPYTMLSYRPKTTREQAVSSAMKLLDCKQFVKDYESGRIAITNPFALTLSCQVELIEQPADYTNPPPEPVYLPLNATIANLKIEATKAFQDVYPLFNRFQVEELCGYDQVEESNQVKFLVGHTGLVKVRGRFLLLHGLEHFRMERGTELWSVSCLCGAKDDDGERMLACDACGIWQHTRCVGINDLNPVPERFLCIKCNGVQSSSKFSKPGGRLACRSKEKDGNRIPLLTTPSREEFPNNCRMVTFSLKTELPPKTDTNFKDISDALQNKSSKNESPTQSGTSGISSCKEETLDVDTYFSEIVPLKCFSKMESPNLSGTTSDETSAVLDTCSSVPADLGIASYCRLVHADNHVV
ncbi:Phd finger protein [Thalictrum thalictroides]|uniref:Phd finger protein n=1 Tax=Thalictrum thalictroides TaxID=46969 RepID=A0A7J6X5Z2_THATH|nr:Phd finger protein [Thalictrum thalictroides]